MAEIFDLPPDLRIYGWSLADIRKVQNWLACQNATLADLDCSRLQIHYWETQRIFDLLGKEPRG